MPTAKPRIMVVVDNDVLDSIEHYRLLNGFKSISQTAYELILKGLSDYNNATIGTSVFSGDEIKLVALFRKLSDAGRNEVLHALINAPKEHPRTITAYPISEDTHHFIDARDLDLFLKAYPHMTASDQRALKFEMLEKTGILAEIDYAEFSDLASERICAPDKPKTSD